MSIWTITYTRYLTKIILREPAMPHRKLVSKAADVQSAALAKPSTSGRISPWSKVAQAPMGRAAHISLAYTTR